jgi:hypothetical protein
MLTPTSIDRLNRINDLKLFFTTTATDNETTGLPLSTAQTYMDLVIKELSLDVLKRDGS